MKPHLTEQLLEVTAFCQEETLFVVRYSLFDKSEQHKITNGHVASTVSLFFTNDEQRITSNVAFDSTADLIYHNSRHPNKLSRLLQHKRFEGLSHR